MSKRILVIDDEPDLRQIVTTILQSKGYEVETASDGQEGLDKIAKSKPDLVLVDLMMPNVSGLEVVRRLKRDEETKGLPIFVMSAAGKDSGKPEEFFREGLGADDFIAKPFDPLNLLGRVEAVLRMADYKKDDEPSAPQGSVSTATPTGPSVDDLPTLDPSGIVKAFIESWNTQSFAIEFRCLSEAMTGGLPEADYVERRSTTATDEQDCVRVQRVTQVVEMTADDETAHVVVEREDEVRGRATKRREAYDLVRGEEHWQIKMVKPVR